MNGKSYNLKKFLLNLRLCDRVNNDNDKKTDIFGKYGQIEKF